MDLGVISALKRCYVSHYLKEILVVLEEHRDFDVFDVNTSGEQTLANIKNYNICWLFIIL